MDSTALADLTRRVFGDTGVRVHYTKTKGRHVIADRDIPTGHVVLTSEPYSMVVGEDDIAMVCHACFSTNELNTNPLSVICPHCEYAYYCDSKCQKVHWERSHERECSYMKKIKPIEMKKDKGYGKAKLRHMVQLFLKRKVEQDAEAAGKADTLPPGPRFSEVRALVSHEAGSHEKEYLEILGHLRTLMPTDIMPDSDSEIIHLLARCDANQFGLWSPKDDLMGLTVHPSASFFNHSCMPNTYCEWNGIKLVFKTLYPIPKGTELNISYIAGNEPTKQRRKELKRIYCFDCTCVRCLRATGPHTYPTTTYDAYFYEFIQCPECTGVMKLDRVREDGHEKRGCMTCEFKRPSVPPVPPLLEFCASFDPKNYPADVFTQPPEKRASAKQAKLKKEAEARAAKKKLKKAMREKTEAAATTPTTTAESAPPQSSPSKKAKKLNVSEDDSSDSDEFAKRLANLEDS